MYMYISVFDKLIWHTIGPKSFLFGTTVFFLWASGAVNCDYIVINSIKSLYSQWHTLTIVEPIWPMLQKVSKTLMYMYVALPQYFKFPSPSNKFSKRKHDNSPDLSPVHSIYQGRMPLLSNHTVMKI